MTRSDGCPVSGRSEIGERRSLSLEEEMSLARRAQAGSREVLDEVIEANLGFVARVGMEHRNVAPSMDDLIGEGNLGLAEAARR